MVEKFETKNAIIKSASFDTERGLSAWLNLDYGDYTQNFGGYQLYVPKRRPAHKNRAPFCGHFVYRCLQIADVENWLDLPGQAIRTLTSHCNCKAIGHIVKDDWFNPLEEFEKLKRMVEDFEELKNRVEICRDCKGEGLVLWNYSGEWDKCTRCNGSGKLRHC